ncbi:uncharacterized protein APUU_61141A [Aspergillus puulaauensis]|uniref:Uncharacterized protein n=1 Tax=Aspergillus puulaauensis TaxID=1220207 RepID=A0A7R7XW94_9EURO|nr:uncharacterized protein APUU_61141A [Aspergillus puulaauensis]BCS28093.1 hypothetical protein APUU_61141A [Aspergillus puulaauensis]
MCKRSFRRKATLTNHQLSSHALGLAIETLSKAYTVSEQDQEQDLPPTPITLPPPQTDPYLFSQQKCGYWDWSYPNIATTPHEFRLLMNAPINSPAAKAAAPVQGQLPVTGHNYNCCAQASSLEWQHAQGHYFQLMQQQQQYIQPFHQQQQQHPPTVWPAPPGLGNGDVPMKP